MLVCPTGCRFKLCIRRFLRINEIGICVPAYICIAEAYLDLNDCTKATNALEQASHSAHVLNEIDCAFNRFHQHESIRLLPFRTDNREISDEVGYYLGRIHFLDGTEPPEEDRINALVSRISYWIQSSEWNNKKTGYGNQSSGWTAGNTGKY